MFRADTQRQSEMKKLNVIRPMYWLSITLRHRFYCGQIDQNGLWHRDSEHSELKHQTTPITQFAYGARLHRTEAHKICKCLRWQWSNVP